MKSFSTQKLEQILSDRRWQLEGERLRLLARTKEWLERWASEYGIEKAYIFGSVTRPYKFHQNSDIDVAVEQINAQDYCTAISFLSEFLGREVDIIQLETCHFAANIRRTGIPWIKTV